MRILNLSDAQKQYGKFSMPGFRSGSILKKCIACLYYFYIIVLFAMSIVAVINYDFADARDIILTIALELVIIVMLIAPVVIIGFSDYYDWHGIKLFLIIISTWCVLLTLANFLSTMFSDEFIKSTYPSESNVEIMSDGEVNNQSDGIKIDDDIIIDELNAQNSSASN